MIPQESTREERVNERRQYLVTLLDWLNEQTNPVPLKYLVNSLSTQVEPPAPTKLIQETLQLGLDIGKITLNDNLEVLQVPQNDSPNHSSPSATAKSL